MKDDKRLIRKLKREIKRAGNRQRRKYLKDVTAEPDEFNFTHNRSDVMNEPRPARNAEGGDPDSEGTRGSQARRLTDADWNSERGETEDDTKRQAREGSEEGLGGD